MTEKTIGQLPEATSVNDADLLEIEQGGVSKKAARSLVKGTSGGSSNVSVIDLGIINAEYVLAAGYIELVPFVAGRQIRKVFFTPDGFIGRSGNDALNPMYFTTPTILADPNGTGTPGIAQWPQGTEQPWDTDRVVKESYGTMPSNDGTYGTATGAMVSDCGPLLVAFCDPAAFPWPIIQPVRTWAAATKFALQDVVIDDAGNLQMVAPSFGANGTTGETEPTWNHTLYQTTTDGTVTWLNVGAPGVGSIHAWAEVFDSPGTFIPKPTTIEFSQQPTNSVAGSPIDPPVSVRVLDQNGDPYTLRSVVVDLEILGAGTATGIGVTFGGATNINTDANTGVATFPNWGITEAATGYVLVARLCSLPIRLNSNPFNVTAP